MKVVQLEHTVFFDVDDTLILNPSEDECHQLVGIKDPLDSKTYIYMRPHKAMIRLLMEEKQRGSFVVVWSRGGWEWATNVVKALGLEGYVHQVMTKPLAYFDDKDVKEWLPYRVYLSPETRYKE